ncbi:MAG: diphosphomevalonate decarboxylase [Pseudomonadota bacterium]
MASGLLERVSTAVRAAGPARTVSVYAPSNIALAKYWGKRDKPANLPLNSSLSVSLGDWGTHTAISPSPDDRDHVLLHDAELAADSPFARRVLRFAERFGGIHRPPLRIHTRNTLPTAAGLASSASGFAALTRALCACFELDLSAREMSVIARLGSGSATRSLWHGFVRWDRGVRPDGEDSHGVPLDLTWPAFRIAVVTVTTEAKAWSSRDGMNHTVATSPLYAAWPERAEADCRAIEQALCDRDASALGPLVEANALAMHATMQSARPALTYLTSTSWSVLERLWQARRDGLEAYATMDAGANVKLVFEADATDAVLEAFPTADIIAPFNHTPR